MEHKDKGVARKPDRPPKPGPGTDKDKHEKGDLQPTPGGQHGDGERSDKESIERPVQLDKDRQPGAHHEDAHRSEPERK